MRLIITKTIEKSWLFDGTYEDFINKIGLSDTLEAREKWQDLIENEYADRDDFFGDAIEAFLDKCGGNSNIDVHIKSL